MFEWKFISFRQLLMVFRPKEHGNEYRDSWNNKNYELEQFYIQTVFSSSKNVETQPRRLTKYENT